MLLSKYHSCVLKSKVLGSEVKFVKKHLKNHLMGFYLQKLNVKCKVRSLFLKITIVTIPETIKADDSLLNPTAKH